MDSINWSALFFFFEVGGRPSNCNCSDMQNGDKVTTIGHGRAAGIAFDSHGDHIFAAGSSTNQPDESKLSVSRGGFWAWRTRDGAAVLEKDLRHYVPGAIAIHPSDRMALLAGDDGRCFLWNLLTGKRACAFRCPAPATPANFAYVGAASAKLTTRLFRAAWSPLGTHYAVASQIAIWGGSLVDAASPPPAAVAPKPVRGKKTVKLAKSSVTARAAADETPSNGPGTAGDNSTPLALLFTAPWKITALCFAGEDVLLVGGEGGQWSLVWFPEAPLPLVTPAAKSSKRSTPPAPAQGAVSLSLPPFSGRVKGLHCLRIPAATAPAPAASPPTARSPAGNTNARKRARIEGAGAEVTAEEIAAAATAPRAVRVLAVAALSDGAISLWELASDPAATAGATGAAAPPLVKLLGRASASPDGRTRLTCTALAAASGASFSGPAMAALWAAPLPVARPEAPIPPLLALPDRALEHVLCGTLAAGDEGKGEDGDVGGDGPWPALLDDFEDPDGVYSATALWARAVKKRTSRCEEGTPCAPLAADRYCICRVHSEIAHCVHPVDETEHTIALPQIRSKLAHAAPTVVCFPT